MGLNSSRGAKGISRLSDVDVCASEKALHCICKTCSLCAVGASKHEAMTSMRILRSRSHRKNRYRPKMYQREIGRCLLITS
jgi:hypothetical protein